MTNANLMENPVPDFVDFLNVDMGYPLAVSAHIAAICQAFGAEGPADFCALPNGVVAAVERLAEELEVALEAGGYLYSHLK